MTNLFIVAVLCEAVWETLKMTWQNDKYLTKDRVGSLVIGILLAFATDIDILKIIQIESKIPFVGVVLCGILLSRGANFIHDLAIKINPNATSKYIK